MQKKRLGWTLVWAGGIGKGALILGTLACMFLDDTVPVPAYVLVGSGAVFTGTAIAGAIIIRRRRKDAPR